MPDGLAAPAVRQDIIRLTQTRSDSFALRWAIVEKLRKHVPFDGFCWWTTDPATMFLTTSVADWMPSTFTCLDIHENEYLDDDFNKFRDLLKAPLPAATLDEATAGQPELSRRYRELMRPDGFESELRAAQAVGGDCWGALSLYRKPGRPAFEAAEVEFVGGLGPHLAEGLRMALLVSAVEAGAAPDASGVVVLDAEGRVTAVTASASHWLGQLRDAVGGRLPEHRLSDAIHAVAAVARGLDGNGSQPPRARVRVDTGEWLLVHAARLERSDESAGEVAVVIEPARPSQIASLLMRVYGLTERETDVVKGVLQGLSTPEIAAATYLSPYTVQDYLKSVFEKVGVHSRRALVAKVFAEQHWPLYGDGDAQLAADGWFADPQLA